MSEDTKKPVSQNLVLKNVRLSYPNLFKAKAFKEGDAPRFSACFLLNKEADKAQIDRVKAEIVRVMKEKWGDSKPANLKHCLRDGAEKPDTDGYGDKVMFVSAAASRKPQVVDRNPAVPLEENDTRLFAGCYVNVSLRFWAQDNKFGKRVNAQILAVQYSKPGEPFGEAPVDATKTFDNEEGAEGDTANDIF